MKIYVGNLPYQMSAGDLQVLFRKFGMVKCVRLIKDRFTFKSRGFGYVNMPMKANALDAIKHLNGKEFFKSVIEVNKMN
jgi:RNA recognition motif-containing protein